MSKYIVCPTCGCEYTPEEVFYPKDVYGKPGRIIRDEDGKIMNIEGTTSVFNETFLCYKCLQKFRATAKLDFKTDLILDDEFDEDYDVPYEKEDILNGV